MGWKIPDKITAIPHDNDLVPFDQGGILRKSTWQKIKEYMLGAATLKTTSQEVIGAVNELKETSDSHTTELENHTAQLSENTKEAYQQTKSITTPYRYLDCVFTFVDDDGHSEFLSLMKPVLDAKGIKCSIATITNNVGTSGFMSISDLKELQNEGFEIISHTKTHSENIFKSASYDLSQVADSTFEAEFADSQNWLINNGFKGYDTLVYPWGLFGGQSTRIKRLARKYYKYGINASTQVANNSPCDNMYIDRYQINKNDDFNSVLKPFIDSAITNKQWVVVLTHCYNDIFDATYLSNMIDYLKSNNVAILPFQEACKYKGNALSIGEFTQSDSFYVGNNGQANRKGVTITPYDAANTMDDDITYYGIGITTKPIRYDKDTLLGVGGSIETIRNSNDDFSYQFFYPYNSNAIYIRHWDNRSTPTKWRSWNKIMQDSEVGITSGTWTPEIHADTDGINTYTTQYGYYYKTGKKVHVEFQIELSSKNGSLAGNIYITGLPFANASGIRGLGCIISCNYLNFPTGYTQITPYTISTGDTKITLSFIGSGVPAQNAQVSCLANNTKITGSIEYITA